MDIMKLKSNFFKMVAEFALKRALKDVISPESELSIESIEIGHRDGEKVDFNISITGSVTETDLLKIIERAQK